MKFTEEQTSNSGGGGKGMFLDIEDGSSVYCVLRGDMKTEYMKWNKSINRYEPSKKGEDGASLRFKTNAIVFEDKKPVAKILKGGGHLYFDLKAINAEYDIETVLIKISRAGIGKNTRYTVIVAGPKTQPDEKTMKTIQAVQLHSLESKASAVMDNTPNFDDEENIPF